MNLYIRRAALAAALLALGGCAGLQAVDADVTSFSHWPAARATAASRYAFERLPSQQAQAAQQDALEAAARRSLSAVGFAPADNPAAADVTVQVGTRTFRYERSPYYDPFWRMNMGFGYGAGSGWGVGAAFPLGGMPVYEREVSVLIRDRASGQVLYESRARSQDNAGSIETMEALFEAALKDFPQPAVSPRRVTIPLPKPAG